MRVLDLSWVWSGPMVTSGLADLGAEVIKVEHPSHPDAARARGRGLRNGHPIPGPVLEMSPYFNQLGHGKKSVAIDLASDHGRDLILDLARRCDVVIENMRPGVMSRRGIGYEDLAKVNPRVVLLSMSTMGQSGPSSQMMGYGVVMSGMAGLEALVGYDAEPMGLFNLAISDPTAGSHALAVLLAALFRSLTTGQGSWVDLSQTECTVALLTEPVLEAQLTGKVVRPGNDHPGYAIHGHFRCAGPDEWVAVSVARGTQSDRLSDALTTWLGRPTMQQDLESGLREWLSSCVAVEGAESLRALGIAAAPVNSFEALQDSGWYEKRGFAATVDHPYLGRSDVVGLPWQVDGHGPILERAAPLLGEDTSDVLTSLLGLPGPEIERMLASGCIATFEGAGDGG